MHLRFFLCTISIFLLFGLNSCTPVIMGLYGMKKEKRIAEKTILRFAKKYNIPATDVYQIDTSYTTYLFSLDSLKFSKEIQNHYQPLQALYYDSRGGYLQSYQVNCYAGGFPNLNWDRDSIMTTFPPKDQAPLDTLFPLKTHLSFLHPLATTEKVDVNDYEHIVIVHWNRWMGRQSKRLIQTIQENRSLATDKAVKILYANTDHLYTYD